MKTSKQDIHDLLAAIANDVEEIKAMLSSDATGADVADKANTSAYTVATDCTAAGNSAANANSNHIVTEVKRLSESVAGMCNRLTDKMKSYNVQLWKHIVSDICEELNSENAVRKRKGLPTVEDKIDNSRTMLVSIYDRLNQLEDAMMPDTPQKEQIGEMQSTCGISVHGKSAKSGIMAWLQSAWLWMRQFHIKRPVRWYRNPYILCAIVIYLLYFGLSIFSWQQWHHYRNENARLRLTADKYRVDSFILREAYPQAAITLSAYGHITETEGAAAAIEVFRDNLKKNNKQKTSSTR